MATVHDTTDRNELCRTTFAKINQALQNRSLSTDFNLRFNSNGTAVVTLFADKYDRPNRVPEGSEWAVELGVPVDKPVTDGDSALGTRYTYTNEDGTIAVEAYSVIDVHRCSVCKRTHRVEP